MFLAEIATVDRSCLHVSSCEKVPVLCKLALQRGPHRQYGDISSVVVIFRAFNFKVHRYHWLPIGEFEFWVNYPMNVMLHSRHLAQISTLKLSLSIVPISNPSPLCALLLI